MSQSLSLMAQPEVDTTLDIVEVTAPVDDTATILAELKRLREENARLKDNKPSGGIKVSDKGGFSVYGLGRFPITMYESQWSRLFAMADEVKAFIKANENDPRVVKARAEHESRKGK